MNFGMILLYGILLLLAWVALGLLLAWMIGGGIKEADQAADPMRNFEADVPRPDDDPPPPRLDTWA